MQSIAAQMQRKEPKLERDPPSLLAGLHWTEHHGIWQGRRLSEGQIMDMSVKRIDRAGTRTHAAAHTAVCMLLDLQVKQLASVSMDCSFTLGAQS